MRMNSILGLIGGSLVGIGCLLIATSCRPSMPSKVCASLGAMVLFLTILSALAYLYPYP